MAQRKSVEAGPLAEAAAGFCTETRARQSAMVKAVDVAKS